MKTGNPEHMKSNAELDFEISAEDMEILKNFEKIKSYGHGKHDKNPIHLPRQCLRDG